MPLSSPAERKPIHNRTITCNGYRREDGLWDIEGRLVDTKSYAFANAWRTEIPAGEALHEMLVRITVDDSLTVVAIECSTDNSPFSMCGEILPNFQRLVGQKIGPGWHRRIKALVGGAEGCTHHAELIGVLATVAFQTLWPILGAQRDSDAARSKGLLIDSCHVWAEGGAIASQLDANPHKPVGALEGPGDNTN
jgi:hypothetical protein